MTDDVADAGDLFPWDLGMTILQVVRQMTAGFGNDLDSALNNPAAVNIALKVFERNAFRFFADTFDRVDHVQ